MTASARRRKFWGWGLEGEGLSESEMKRLGETFGERFGIGQVRLQEPPRVEELDLRAPRLAPPASLEAAFSADAYERAAHTYGRSFRDLVRAFRRDYSHAPDLVAFPGVLADTRDAIHSRVKGDLEPCHHDHPASV